MVNPSPPLISVISMSSVSKDGPVLHLCCQTMFTYRDVTGRFLLPGTNTIF